MSRKATVPGLNLCAFFTPIPRVAGTLPFDVFEATPFLGCLLPVAFLAVCFVRAIFFKNN